MFQFVLIILAILIVFTMAGYAFYLLVKLRQQQTAK
ncbi:coproporphyrinogen III oxidase [[Haemophilus] ducreyi]|nr:coproporphyrinogen III oxidase [[Haemophilus] ducreyi]